MRATIILLLIFVTGCAVLRPASAVWRPERPVIIGAATYDWPAPLIVDAIADAVDQEGGAIIRIESQPVVSLLTFATPHGRYTAEVTQVAPDISTVTLTHPPKSESTPELAEGFYAALEERLGMN